MSARLQEFARQIEAAQRAARFKKISRIWIPTATPASMLGYRCERRIVYARVHPELAQAPGEELASIFDEGNHHEAQIKRELSELGFELMDGQTEFADARLDIKGHVDGRVQTPWGTRVPVEIKSWSGDGPRTEEEWRDNPTPLLRRYFDQLSTYLYLTNQEEGLGLFKSKLTGLWTMPAIDLDFAHVEALLSRAERVRDAVRKWQIEPDRPLPQRIPDRSECNGCPYSLTCLPSEAPVDPLLIAHDEELAKQLERREQLKADSKEFEKLDDTIKERFRLTKGERFACGNFLVEKRTNKVGAITVKIEALSETPRGSF